MKPLNLRTQGRVYGERTIGEQIEWKKKFFILAEGDTEEAYFRGIDNYKKELGIDKLIRIEVLSKEEDSKNLSHPQQLVEAALRALGRLDLQGNAIPENEWGNT